MRPKNLVITGTTEELRRLAEEYRILGYSVILSKGELTVLTRAPKRNKKRIFRRRKR